MTGTPTEEGLQLSTLLLVAYAHVVQALSRSDCLRSVLGKNILLMITTLQRVDDGASLENTLHLGRVALDRLRGQVRHGHLLRLRLLALALLELDCRTAIFGWALTLPLLLEDMIGLDLLVHLDDPLILEVVVIAVAAAILLDLEILLISEHKIYNFRILIFARPRCRIYPEVPHMLFLTTSTDFTKDWISNLSQLFCSHVHFDFNSFLLRLL